MEQDVHNIYTLTNNCSELDKLVLNFLLVEGYKEAADAFAHESSLPTPTPTTPTASISTRTALRHHLLAGDCRAAISLLNDACPDLLDGDHLLAARLYVQLFVEMVRVNNNSNSEGVREVLMVAREQVAPVLLAALKKAANKQASADAETLLNDFNKALAVLLVQGEAAGKCGVMEVGRRKAVAVAVNKAVLEAAGQESESILPKLLQLQAARIQ